MTHFFQNWIITTGYCGQLNDELDHNNFIVIAGEFNLNSVDGNEQVNFISIVHSPRQVLSMY